MINQTIVGKSNTTIKGLIVSITLFMSAISFAQTTVTLEDQCKCSVLSGNDVNVAGETTPAGAETGDIYVNTTNGSIFFWDGDTWELTNEDNNDINTLLFDPLSNELEITMTDGTVYNTILNISVAASAVVYDNTGSGIDANNVQEAIDKVSERSGIFPVINASGKVNPDGTAAIIFGATVSRISEGDYQITFNTPLTTDYIIQVSVLDCDGDCPGNTTDLYDNPSITYYDQQLSGFKVNIGDSDNGANPKDDIDLEFMFSTIILPN